MPKIPPSRVIFSLVLVLLVDLAFIVVWKATPLAEWIRQERLVALLDALWAERLGPPVVLLCVVLASMAAIPIHALLLALVVVIASPWTAATVAFVGAFLSAALAYSAGNLLGSRFFERHLSNRWRHAPLLRRLRTAGVGTMIVVRMLPLGPYPIVNAACGAEGVPVRSFLWATAIVLFPGHLSVAFMTSRLAPLLERWNLTWTETRGLLLGILGLLAVLLVVGGVWLMRRRRPLREL